MFTQVDLHLYESSMFGHRFYVTDCFGNPLDMTDYNARLEIRREPDGALLYASTSADDLAVDADGFVTVLWSGVITEAIGHTLGPALKYDLFIWPSGRPEQAVVVSHGYVVTKKNIAVPELVVG